MKVEEFVMDLFDKVDGRKVDGDYEKDGILYCGKCHTAKQVKTNICGKDRVFWCNCDCEAKRIEQDEHKLMQQSLMQLTSMRKKEAFGDAEMAEFCFANDDNTNFEITNAMKAYADNFNHFAMDGRGLLLWGVVDGGKTFYACCVLNELMDHGYACKATSFQEIANKSMQTFNKDEYFKSFNQYDLLLIDDLGTERKSDYMKEITYEIINTRYLAKLPMIITTNLSLVDITKSSLNGASGDVAEDRIFSRIVERCHPINVPFSNHRIVKGRQSYNDTKKLLGI